MQISTEKHFLGQNTKRNVTNVQNELDFVLVMNQYYYRFLQHVTVKSELQT